MSAASVRVKVCGVTRYEDARLALDLGAWALGFIFHPGSPRRIEPDAARELRRRLPGDARVIGVFVDRTAQEMQDVIDHVGLAGAQLHGNEPPAALRSLRAEVLMKAFRVGDEFDERAVDAYVEACPSALVLLDTFRRGQAGGTGETFDWSVARDLARRHDVVLAGGIGAANAVEAVRAVRVYAIDASSRLESRPGVKDPRKLQQLFERLRADSAS